MSKKVMGIDPSMRSTGICIAHENKYKYILIPSAPTKKLLNFKHKSLEILNYEPESVKDKTSVGKEMAIASNIKSIVDRIEQLIKKHKPDYIVIESCAFAAAGRVADLSGLNHCIRYVAARVGVPCYAVVSTTNKLLFTGNGQATKEMMVESWKVCDPVARDIVAIGKSAEDLADAFSLSLFPEERLKIR